LIIPDTVPNNPIVPKDTNEEIIVMFFCNIGISSEVASYFFVNSLCSFFTIETFFLTAWYLIKADLIAFATEPCCLSHVAIASSISPCLILAWFLSWKRLS
jgi:hypothetical protein